MRRRSPPTDGRTRIILGLLTAPLRAAGRAALAAVFVESGYSTAVRPGQRVERAAQAGVPAPQLAVRLNGAAMVLFGTTLGLGIRPRLSAAALAGLLVPTTLVGHPFWEETDPARRAQHQVHVLKNLGLLGGLVEVVLAPRRGAAGRVARDRAEAAAVRSRARVERAAARSRARAEDAAGAIWEKAAAIVA